MFLLPILEMSLGLGSSVELELRGSYLTVAQSVGEGDGVEDSESVPWTNLRPTPSVTGRLRESS